ncbi:putative methyltransferase-domain-containing protein [Lipomyces doorenjongii]|uniref:putative methyltransferase-domain-containing protein n=1 Tax=Lipomyces doorenjongii TaxID=383834 RepID=UPI0034CDBB58
MSDTESVLGNGDELFREPDDFYKPEDPPSFDTYERKPELVRASEPSEITLRLVGKSPLWGHLLWNASKVTANYLDMHGSRLLANKTVLELGAGAGLPSFIAAIHDAKRVVITDYPEADLIANIDYNVDQYARESHVERTERERFRVAGYIWGNDTEQLCKFLPEGSDGYDLIILSDVVFNHSEHSKLLATCWNCLSRRNNDSKVFVVFTPHRARLFHRDLQFFEDAIQLGFKVEKLFEEKWSPMFEEEEETKDIRSMVYGYFLSF